MTHSRSRSVACSHVQTTREQLQQQRLYIYRLTPMKCPHLLSHETTGQVDSGALGPISQFPARRVVSGCCLFLLGRALFCSRKGWAAIPSFALLATLSTGVFIGHFPTNGRRVTLQPNLSVATRPTLYMRILAPHSNTGLSETSHVQFASRSTLHTSLAKLLHVMGCFMSCSTFSLKSCSQTGLICIFPESVTPSPSKS